MIKIWYVYEVASIWILALLGTSEVSPQLRIVSHVCMLANCNALPVLNYLCHILP
jgi:hypothetical protein